MTNREICERLMEIRDALYSGWNDDHKPSRELCRDAAYDLRVLLLNIAAPETANPFKGMSVADLAANAEWLRTPYIKPEEEKPEREEKHPGVLVPVNEKYPATCLKCGGEVQMLHEDGVYYCPKCNAAFCAPKGELKREEGEK